MKEIGVVSWKLPPREMSYQHFREIFPQRKLPRLQYMNVIRPFIANWLEGRTIKYTNFPAKYMNSRSKLH